MSKQVICLLCGGQSTEHEVSLMSARNVAAAIPQDKYDTLIIGIDKEGSWHWYEDGAFAENADDPAAIRLAAGGTPVCPIRFNGRCVLAILAYGRAPVPFDIMFPVLHGVNGEDGAVQGLAQLLGCPCVGCGMTSSALCMDKAFTKQVLEHEGIATAPWIQLKQGEDIPKADDVIARLELPLFVKPANAGSSVGVVKVHNADEFLPAVKEALSYDSKVLVEKAIVGREIECAVMGNIHTFAAVPGEIIPKADFYSYDAKYTMADGAELVAPAPLTEEQRSTVQALAQKIYKVLGCKGLSRVDFFLTTDGQWLLNEINTIPGFTKISMFPRLMGLSGIPYSTLIDKLIQLALDKE